MLHCVCGVNVERDLDLKISSFGVKFEISSERTKSKLYNDPSGQCIHARLTLLSFFPKHVFGQFVTRQAHALEVNVSETTEPIRKYLTAKSIKLCYQVCILTICDKLFFCHFGGGKLIK